MPSRDKEVKRPSRSVAPHARRRRQPDELAPELLCFGVQFADGSKAANIAGFHGIAGQAPAGPLMHTRGGGGDGGSRRQAYWVWPLPPRGTLEPVCEWPALGIPLTRTALDAQPILEAAGRAQVIFPDEPLPEGPNAGAGPPAAASAH